MNKKDTQKITTSSFSEEELQKSADKLWSQILDLSGQLQSEDQEAGRLATELIDKSPHKALILFYLQQQTYQTANYGYNYSEINKLTRECLGTNHSMLKFSEEIRRTGKPEDLIIFKRLVGEYLQDLVNSVGLTFIKKIVLEI